MKILSKTYIFRCKNGSQAPKLRSSIESFFLIFFHELPLPLIPSGSQPLDNCRLASSLIPPPWSCPAIHHPASSVLETEARIGRTKCVAIGWCGGYGVYYCLKYLSPFVLKPVPPRHSFPWFCFLPSTLIPFSYHQKHHQSSSWASPRPLLRMAAAPLPRSARQLSWSTLATSRRPIAPRTQASRMYHSAPHSAHGFGLRHFKRPLGTG